MKTSIKTGILYIQEWEYQQIAHKVRKWSEKFQKAKSISGSFIADCFDAEIWLLVDIQGSGC